jgi:hypothetical protein
MVKITREEHLIIHKIATRAILYCAENNIKYDLLTCWMDIECVHLVSYMLDLDRLLKADDADFFHDVFGIRRHLDRETEKLTGFFVPRFMMLSRRPRSKLYGEVKHG